MDPSRRPQNTSGIPRLSRLPIPRAGAISATTASKLPKPSSSTREPQKEQWKSQLGSRGGGRPQGMPTLPQTDETPEMEPVHQSIPPSQPETPQRGAYSLADRTMETLSHIPPTPTPGRRRSSFFRPQTPSASPSRPTSSLARARPSTSHGHRPTFASSVAGSRPSSPEKRQLLPTSGNITPLKTLSKFQAAPAGSQSARRPTSRLDGRPDFSSSISRPPPLPRTRDAPSRSSRQELPGASKTFAGRSSKPRPSLQSTFGSSVVGKPEQEEQKIGMGTKKPPVQKPRSTPKGSTAPRRNVIDDPASAQSASPKSSAALRETIAKAKAVHAKSRMARQSSGGPIRDTGDTWDPGDIGGNNTGVLRKRIAIARTDGRLNIAAMNLAKIPPEVMNMYGAENLASNDGNWYESVDLVRLIAADNVIETLEDELFPDVSPEDSYLDDNYKGSPFSGLETMDLHGNHLQSLPLGIRQLKNLTVLNLSKNRLSSEGFAVLNQINGLRELRIAENPINQALDDQLSGLQQLEILDLRSCGITSISSNLNTLKSLRILIVACNRLDLLPLDVLAALPLAELDVSHNSLQGQLLSDADCEMLNLKSLDVSYNALTSLCDGKLAMPSLQSLNLAENRIQRLPDLSECQSLVTFSASGNNITETPDSLATLKNLKNIDLSCNDLRKLDERLGLLEGLTVLRVASNPLRDRKFLTMNTDDVKRELRARCEPANSEDEDSFDTVIRPNHVRRKGWNMLPGGVLERSEPKIDAISDSEMQDLIRGEPVKSLLLSQNNFTELPLSISSVAATLTVLDLPGNRLSGISYLSKELQLPNLKSLDLSQNQISSLQPLLTHLDAPSLLELKLTRNRLVDLVPLKPSFPALTTVLAANNSIATLPVESVEGLETIDVSGNEIEHLEARIGKLSMAQGGHLRTFIVEANRFRVPRRDVVEKGTGAILEWLRGRIPEE